MSRFISGMIWNCSKYCWKTFWANETCFKKYNSCKKKSFRKDEEKYWYRKVKPRHKNCSRKNLKQQRKFFSSAKQKRKYDIRYTKPADKEKALLMWQNTFLEEAVEKDVLLRDTKEEAIKLTKGMAMLCFK